MADSKFSKEKKIKRLLIVIVIFSALTGIYNYCSNEYSLPVGWNPIYINTTASVPRGVYIRTSDNVYREGDYVIFTPNDECLKIALDRGYITSKDTLFLKKIGALGGSHFRITSNRQFFVNDNYIGEARLADADGRPLPNFLEGVHIVKPGEFLPIASNPRSFDGRYTGTVPISNIKAKVVPVFTE